MTPAASLMLAPVPRVTLNLLSPHTRTLLARCGLGGIVAGFGLLLGYEISEALVGHHDFNTAYMSTAAGNHLRHGFGATGFGLVMDNGAIAPERFTYYLDHPPLVPVIVALSFAAFGEHEWSARLVPICFSLGTLLLVYLLGRRLHSRTLGLLSATIFGLLPMTGYFGRMVNHEAPTNFFVVAAVLAYVDWRSSRTSRMFAVMVAAFVAGALSGWPAYYLGLLLPLHHAATSRREAFDRRILLLPALCFALFAAHMAHTVFLQGADGATALFDALRLRTSQSATDDASGSFGWLAFADRHASRLLDLYTWPALLLAAACVVSQSGISRRVHVSDRLLIPLLLVFGITHVALFRQGSWIHDYWMFYLSVPLALAAGEGVLFLSRWRLGWLPAAALLLLLPLVALPKTLDMHGWGDENAWQFYHLGLLLKAHTRPEEIIVKSAGDAWWDVSAPQTLYYARRSGVGREPILDMNTLERLLQDKDSGPFAFILFHRKDDAGYLDVWVDDDARAARFEARLGEEFPMEEVGYNGHRFKIVHIGRQKSPGVPVPDGLLRR